VELLRSCALNHVFEELMLIFAGERLKEEPLASKEGEDPLAE
jgi:hypothetical protein